MFFRRLFIIFLIYSWPFSIWGATVLPDILSGYSSDYDTYLSPCLEGVAHYTASDASAELNARHNLTREELFWDMSAKGEVEVHIPYFNGTHSAETRNFFREVTESRSYYVRFKALTYSKVLENFGLNAFGEKALKLSPDYSYFLNKCGDRFVNRIDYGGELNLRLSVSIYDREEIYSFKQQIKVEIDLGVKEIEITIDRSFVNHERKVNGVVDFSGLQIGGDKTALAKRLRRLQKIPITCARITETACVMNLSKIMVPRDDEISRDISVADYFFSYLEDFRAQINSNRYAYKIHTRSFIDADIVGGTADPSSTMTGVQRREWNKAYLLSVDFSGLLDDYKEALKGQFYGPVQKEKIRLSYERQLARHRKLLQRVYLCERDHTLCDGMNDDLIRDFSDNPALCHPPGKECFNKEKDFNEQLKLLIPQKDLYYYCMSLSSEDGPTNVILNEAENLDVRKFMKIPGESKSCEEIHRYYSSVKSLDLSRSGIKSFDLLKFYPQIVRLDLSYLFDGSLPFSSLKPLVDHLPKLRELSLKGNNFQTLDHAKALFVKLTAIDVSLNRLRTIDFLSEKLQSKIPLVRLDLSGNFLSFEGLRSLVPLMNLRKPLLGLTELKVFGNFYNATLPEVISTFSKGQMIKFEQELICHELEEYARKWGTSVSGDTDLVNGFGRWFGARTEEVKECRHIVAILSQKKAGL